MNEDCIFAPFTAEQAAALNRWQRAGHVHPFTCQNEHIGDRVLVAHVGAGWVCPTCGYFQTWAHRMMLKPPLSLVVGIDHSKLTLVPSENDFIVGLSGGSFCCAKITADGEVFINWDATERAAADPADHNPMTRAIVRLMIAIRDGIWETMP